MSCVTLSELVNFSEPALPVCEREVLIVPASEHCAEMKTWHRVGPKVLEK